MMQSYMLLMDLGVIFVLTAVLLAMPVLSRPEFLFGITVPADFQATPQGRAITHGYALGIVIAAALCISLALVTGLAVTDGMQLVGVIASPLLMLCSAAAVYMHARRHVRPYAVAADRRREAQLTAPPSVSDVLPRPLAWHALPYLLLAAAAAWLALHWDAIPAVYADHVGLQGKVDGYAHKSITTVYMPVFIGLFSVAAAHGAMLLGLAVRRLPDTLARARVFNVALLQLMCVLACLFGCLSFIPLLGVTLLTGTAGLGLMLGSLAALVLLPGVTLFRGLRHVRAELSTGKGDHTPDAAWKFGSLYYNPDDPSAFVEKRFGIGYTLNFAHPAAYIVIVGILALVTLILIGANQTPQP